MPRPARTDRPVEKNISLPQSVVTQIDLLLFSELEGKVPHGAWARLINQLLADYLDRANRDERLKHQLRRILEANGVNDPDPRNFDFGEAHRMMDLALVSELNSLGYTTSLDIYNTAPKHYG